MVLQMVAYDDMDWIFTVIVTITLQIITLSNSGFTGH